MKYFLYGGCSLEAGGKNYMISLEPVCEALGMEFEEIDDWNCCGASVSYAGANELSITTLNARNIAIAESTGGYDIVAPCSSCYIQMIKANHELKESEDLRKQINDILKEGNLSFKGTLNVRHIMDLLYNDAGIENIKAKTIKPLNGLKVAGYVGCQTVRPYGEYDSVERPVVHDRLLEAIGADPVPFPKRMQCCGSGIFLSEMDKCLGLVNEILEDALDNGAELISTVCPMCAMNLEMFQDKVNAKFGTNFDVPVVYLTQLMAAAFGMNLKKDAALNYNVIPPEGIIKTAIGG
ncbi:MAG: CoB--CoM heterodisulfide reductase iron-sulfur subunit B family protein [Deltaproteobacteria bacterium]|nr:CoB--CoM heterodisulfide reductase iron-sulfur subunit B family protein [Deltaproteobacteria bacterium]